MKAELLMPAGNFNKLKTAFHFGADAVYLGGKDFSLRAYADNFTKEELESAVIYAHSLNKKVYVTANIFAKNSDFDSAANYFKFLADIHADAVLISDIGLLSLAKQVAPTLPIHLSTQANTTNKYSVKFWKDLGVERVVLARELSLQEIAEIHEYVPDVELECFVHGAMCMSYSGRCLLSAYFSERSANRGECIQPCRWNYTITEKINHYEKPLDVEQDERGTYFMNSKDLRLLSRIPEILNSGVFSLKVEGRMKSEFYVATVALCYRKALDEYLKNGKIDNLKFYMDELETIAHRTYTEAYFDNEKNLDTVSSKQAQMPEQYAFTAVVESFENEYATVEMRNRFQKGQNLQVLSPSKNAYKEFTVTDIFDETNEQTDDAKLVQHHYKIKVPFELSKGDILRRKI